MLGLTESMAEGEQGLLAMGGVGRTDRDPVEIVPRAELRGVVVNRFDTETVGKRLRSLSAAPTDRYHLRPGMTLQAGDMAGSGEGACPDHSETQLAVVVVHGADDIRAYGITRSASAVASLPLTGS